MEQKQLEDTVRKLLYNRRVFTDLLLEDLLNLSLRKIEIEHIQYNPGHTICMKDVYQTKTVELWLDIKDNSIIAMRCGHQCVYYKK